MVSEGLDLVPEQQRSQAALRRVYAALAEQERDFISARSKAALKAAKARGKALGGLRDTTMRRNTAIQQKPPRRLRGSSRLSAPCVTPGRPLAQLPLG